MTRILEIIFHWSLALIVLYSITEAKRLIDFWKHRIASSIFSVSTTMWNWLCKLCFFLNFCTLVIKDIFQNSFKLGVIKTLVYLPPIMGNTDLNSWWLLMCYIMRFLYAFSQGNHGGVTDSTTFVICSFLQVASFLWFLRRDVVWTCQAGNQVWR